MAHFTLVRDALIRRRAVPDVAFDAVYPCWAQEASARFWTPVHVAIAAGLLLRGAGAKAVLDVGSGVGKFAVVASLAADLNVTGVEQRPSLVASARHAAERYRACAQFVCANIEQIEPKAYDALYLFNPFGENLVSADERLDDSVPLSPERYERDVALVERWLEESPLGSSFVTYNGFGGRIPASYRMVRSRNVGRHFVRLWTKRGHAVRQRVFVEVRDDVIAIPLLRSGSATAV
jgi:SAM-dependent methyltransferase